MADDGSMLSFTALLEPGSETIRQLPDPGVAVETFGLVWSPDGTRLLAQATAEEGGALIVLAVDDSRAPQSLPDATRLASGPTWAPNGERIAFGHGSPGDPDLAAYVMAADGTDLRPVLSAGFAPAWSPDGRTLAVIAEDQAKPTRPSSLHLVDADTGASRKVAEDAWGLSTDTRFVTPLWSPDGRSIAFGGPGPLCEICVASVETGDVRPVLDHQAINGDSGDTLSIVGWLDDTALLGVRTSGLYRVSVVDDRIEPIVEVATGVGQPALSPDRGWIAYATLIGPATMTVAIEMVAADGGQPIQLTFPAPGMIDQRPSWQPAPAPVSWAAWVMPSPSPTPTVMAAEVTLAVTGDATGERTAAGTCQSNGDVVRIEVFTDDFSVQMDVGPDGQPTLLSVTVGGFAAEQGKGFESRAPWVVGEADSTQSAGALAFTDLREWTGALAPRSGRIIWACDLPPG